jgi:hypothetical protein
MTQHLDLFAALAAPFDPSEEKIRSQGSRQLHYVTARTVMNRLDEVLGPANWWDDYVPLEHSVICRLTIRLPDGTTLTKCDAGGYAGMADSGDDDKSGFSDSFKRAAVKFGVARYLYRDGLPGYVRERYPDRELDSERSAASAEPAPAPVPVSASVPAPVAPAPVPATKDAPNPPKNGKALFAWIKDIDERYEYDLLRQINGWAKRQDFPGRMVNWDTEQVSQAFSEAYRRVKAFQNGQREAREEAAVN